MTTRSAIRLTRRLALCCAALAGLALSPGARASQSQAPTIVVGEPEEFASLIEDQVLLVDVYFGGAREGEARIAASPGALSFLDPAAVLALLPELKDAAAVEAALAGGSLPANSRLACSTTSNRAQCGRLDPDVAGVIFDRDRFRVDIFLNPRFVAVRDNFAEVYLPAPQREPAMINSVAGVISGQTGGRATYYNVQDSLVIASGERRLRADVSYASELGFGAERLAIEWDRPGLRYSAGALWAPGSEIAGRRKLIGIGVESQIDTRLDRDEILGSPIVVYLDQRARVDVVRDGRVLNSAIYEAGNQQIDTANLPDGSYDIVLRIDEPGRPAREERRFFTKSRRLPSKGRTDFFAFGGVTVDEFRRGSLAPSGTPYLQGGVAHRLSERWALAGGIEATDKSASAEVAATFLTPVVQVRAAAVADLDGGYGSILQLSSAGTSRLNFNFDLRRIERAVGDESPLAPPAPPAEPANPFDFPDPVRHGESYSQIGGIVSYSLANLRFLGTVFYREDDAQEARYSIGPALEWDVVRKGKLTLTLRGDLTATERGNSGFAGVSLRMLGASAGFTALGGARASRVTGDELGEGPVAAVSGAWSPAVAGGELAIGAGFEHQPRQDSAILSSDFRHRLGSLSGDFVRSESPASSATQYTAGFQTTFAAGAGVVQVAGKTTTESMIVAQVDGAGAEDRFEVLVNEQVAGTIEGVGAAILALPTYRAYQVRIRPTGEALLAYDNSSRSVGLYPGAVTRLEWTSAPISIKFGRLVAPDGTPVRRASITGKGVWSETDDEGYFQIEIAEGAELTVTLPDGTSFTTTLPAGEENGGVARIGSVVCCGRGEVTLGALDFPDQTRDRETR